MSANQNPILYDRNVYVRMNLPALKVESAIVSAGIPAPMIGYHNTQGQKYLDGYAYWEFRGLTMAQWTRCLEIGDDHEVDFRFDEPWHEGAK
mgnify:CR=1 FL=1